MARRVSLSRQALRKRAAEERAQNKDVLVTGTIRTHVPCKWRFVDLETGDVWGMEPDGSLTRRTDIEVRIKRIPIVPYEERRAAISEGNRRTREAAQQHEPFKYAGGWLVKNIVTREFFDANGVRVGGP
jgi:hypothetical protein